jgi:hypothetical protein
MKQNNIWKGKLGDQSEFSLMFACWANNHRGKSKAKKSNKRSARRRLNQELQKQIEKE